ncbi:hypothetical protein KKA93_01265 [Patescibacteria group bacterium]|nr:hypothetical protein [Patescibacteria group bacterium]MBU1663022.1 hypothetical protein [Patescibacteria group bacterium]MBU1933834.1 hypothetical protein [Patescibacteria group bacterium]MBU2007641.1 hypothetical protein [Patescibacteria group bacterium]MBU2233726.1 hypothetical protein [Patescibacteria group bacterium]
MQNQLQKAISLAKKTGDKLIVFDSAKPDNVFVVLSLKDYENLVLGKSEIRGLTEDELLDKINRDIAIWKSDQKDQGEMENIDMIPDYFRELPDKEENFETAIKRAGKSWSIPSKRKIAAEEIIEEDRQYLEELAF